VKNIFGIFRRSNPNREQKSHAGEQPLPREGDRNLPPPAAPPSPHGVADLRSGEVVDGFRILGELGKGGFGVVYAVQELPTDFIYALKTFRGDLLISPEVREAFRKEALAWVSLGEHPFIVPALRVLNVSGRLGVVTQCIVPAEGLGVSLYDHLARTHTPIAQPRLLEWAIQFCYAMEYANGRGFKAHRDIKPQNILLDKGEVLKLSDFGLADAAQSLQGIDKVSPHRRANGEFGLSVAEADGRNICGTPGYLAPELYEGSRANAATDIYSFGIVLWQMAFGRPSPPFKYSAARDVFRAIYEQQCTVKIATPEGELGRIIARCLDVKPDRRFQKFADLRAELEPLLSRFGGAQVVIPKGAGPVLKDTDGLSLANLGQHEMAVRVYEQELERDPNDRAALVNLGASLRVLGRYELALQYYDRALAVDPGSAVPWANKGTCLDALGRFTEAIPCFDRALELDANHPVAWFSKGNSLDHLGRASEAIACYDQALKLDPASLSAWFNKGVCLQTAMQFDGAMRCYDSALALYPAHAGSLHAKGVCLLAQGRFGEALRWFEGALQIVPTAAALWRGKSDSLEKLGRAEEALVSYQKTLELDPKNANAWYNLAILLNRLGKNRDALNAIDRALDIEPEFGPAWFSKTGILLGLDRYDAVIRCSDMALQLNQESAELLSNRGLALDSLGKYEEASVCFKRAVELNPKFGPAWFNQAATLRALGRHGDAIQCLEHALELAPQDADSTYWVGVSLEALHHHEDAVRSYKQAVALNPRLVDAWYRRGNCLQQLGRHGDAIQSYGVAVMRDPRHTDAWVRKSEAEEAVNDISSAIASIRTYLGLARSDSSQASKIPAVQARLRQLENRAGVAERAPTNESMTKQAAPQPSQERQQSAIELTNKGNALWSAEHCEEALACYERAIGIHPQCAEAWHSKGVALTRMGRHEQALDCYDRVLAIRPQVPEPWFNKGVELGKLGRYREALACFERADELGNAQASTIVAKLRKALGDEASGR
jgi:tetratricopeptide (TPR) repeat protein